MGVVIDKTVQILKLVADREHQTLKSLCEATGSKKPALCLMLRSLVENGMLRKNAQGEYQIGPLLFELTAPRNWEMRLLEAADAVSAELNSVCRESVNIATIRNGKYRRLVSRSCMQAVRIAVEAPDEEHFYGNATGRSLLAYASEAVRDQIISRLGVPSYMVWSDASEGRAALLAELEKIRLQKYAECFRHDGEVCYLAVCTVKPGDDTPVALGINVPVYRCNKKHLLELLHQAAERLSKSF